MQADAPAEEKVPAEHAEQVIPFVVKVPAEQAWHMPAPEAEMLPLAHVLQEVEPVLD